LGLLQSRTWRPALYADELIYLTAMDRVVGDMRGPYRGQSAYREDVFPRYAVMSSILVHDFSRSKAAAYRATAHIAGTRIALALAAYKDRFGAYPRSLAELRVKLGWAIEQDPLSGKDFVYRRENKGFVLYSVGENLKDDGARPWVRNQPSEGYDYTNAKGERVADIVWEIER
jgi:hypothetical protein